MHVQNLECLLLDLDNDSNSLGINLDHVTETVLTWREIIIIEIIKHNRHYATDQDCPHQLPCLYTIGDHEAKSSVRALSGHYNN